MVILREYRSVVFWLIFVSLWIIGCDTCCGDDDDDETEKDKNTSWYIADMNNNNNNIIDPYNNQINNNIVNNINQNSQPQVVQPIATYTNPTLIGLNNIGATCFMNSVLQCLSQTKALTNYFLNPQNKNRIFNNNIALKNPNDFQLTPLYWQLISKLWDKNRPKTNFSPCDFMNGVQSVNHLFKKGEAGDAKDFIIYILEQIHNELKKPTKNYKESNLPLNQYDKDNAFNNFFNEFQKGVSVISDTFYGFNETTNICLPCKNNYGSKGLPYPISYNYGIFNCIIFPLEEVKKMRDTVVQMYNIMNNTTYPYPNSVTLTDCFFYNQKTDKFTGENQIYCNACNQMCDSDYTTHIYSAPNVLILILNRGKNNMYDIKIEFPLNLELTGFVVLKDKPRILYNLYGVITHIGKSGPNAHFVATCKSPVNGQWYRYNDALVSPIYNFKKEVHDFATPYVLFYEKAQ